MSATTKAAFAAGAAKYVVALGVLVTLDAKSKKTIEIGEGKPFKPTDDAEAEDLLKAGRIMLAEDYAAKVGGVTVTAAVDAANTRADAAEQTAATEKARADALQAELDKLKAAPAQT